MMWRYLCYSVAFLFGSVMLFGGAFVLNSIPSLLSDKIKSQLPIVKGTDAYTRYTESRVPLHVRMYLFNVTNPEEVLKGAKPRLQQIGPFTLSERRRRNITAISSDNSTLDYRLIRAYFFNATESPPLDSILTLPNAPAFSAAFNAEEKKVDEDGAADPVAIMKDYLKNETMYITKTADEWLFKGIKLNWLEASIQDGIPIEDAPPDNTFGFYYKKNDTWDEKADGTMTIATGADGNFTNIGQVVRWNKKNAVSFWRGNPCNIIKGTDGQFFHPFIQKDEKLDIFAPDLCRTLSIEYIKTTSIRSIELYRFGISANFFRPIDYDQDTKCYCVKKTHADKQKFCKLSGVIDVSSCRKKPIVLSTPHFFNGDPILRDAVEGMSPSAANHDTFIDIEPMTGAVLRVRRRLQVNVEMKPNEALEASQVLKERIIHPFIWIDQSVTIPDELAQKLENKLTKIVRMLRILCYAALITGPIILTALLIFICRSVKSEDKKLKSFKSSTSPKAGGDYQKVQMKLKDMENNENETTNALL